MKKILSLIILLILYYTYSYATHQRAGEITYKWISDYTYEITLVTYTFTPSPADRPELDVLWGDGTSSTLPRIEKINMPNDISKNTYIGVHSYAAPGTYKISMEDPNRNYGILNIPNSVNVPFYIETILNINPFIGPNNSPVLLNPPIDNGCVNELFIHNPAAYDPDGDSLSYMLGVCKGENGLDIAGYTLPLASNSISINPYTGDLIWDKPILQGEYNIVILIQEWRHGVLISTILRDMQIQIVACNNQPPKISNIQDTCIEAGNSLSLNISATDVNNNSITLTASGGPLLQTISPAQFQATTGIGSVNSIFYWDTKCEHVRKQPWQVYFKATDNGQPVNLVDLKTVNITIVAPAPQNLTAQPIGNSIALNWSISPCLNAIGYRIYRKNSYYGYQHSYCETGVPAYTGYIKIADIPDVNTTYYIDNNNGQGLLQGLEYCYMVIAYFADGAESYASNETCTSLKHETPIITNVSIRNTSNTQGSIYVAWSKPTELDTIQYSGPYKYYIYRSEGFYGTTFSLIDSLSNLNDTIWIDTLLNTKNKAYSYKIGLSNDTPGNYAWLGYSQVASSIFLSIIPSDNTLQLMWSLNVPWINNLYTIYRFNNNTFLFDSIASVTTNQFYDTGLNNGTEFCYLIKSIGKYSSSGLINPIINWSQIACASPIDLEPPCTPNVTISPDCDLIKNIITWDLPYDTCLSDILKYEIYYTPIENGELTLIYTTNNLNDNTYIHDTLSSIAGCYSVIAIDSFGNHSSFNNITCIDIDNCSLYNLPNVFTPDGDGINDYFKPFPYNFVEKIDITIFNRWGEIVFETTNPDVNWDGKNQYTKKDCSDGVYYYICDIYEKRLKGIVKRTTQGVIHLLRK